MNLGLFALKNIGRTPVRSALQVGGMAIITALMLIWGSLQNGLQDLLTQAATSLDVGELQVHAPGYLNNPDLYNVVPEGPAVISALKSKNFAVSRRLYGFALAALGEQSLGVQVRGVDLAEESTVTTVDSHMERGKWLTDDGKSIVIGRILAHRLHIAEGQDMLLLTQAADGSTANALFRVVGILKPTSVDIDTRAVYLAEKGFRDFYHLPEGIHELAVKRLNEAQPPRLARALVEASVKAVSKTAEVKSWRELKPLLAQGIDLMNVVSYFILAFVYLSLGGLIVNITFMTIDGRLTEIGTMTALGMQPQQVVTLIMAEAGCAALLSSILAWALGIPIVLWLTRHGLDLRSLFEQYSWVGINLETILTARIGAWEALTPVAFMVGAILIFSLYPGIDAALLPPIKALRQR